MVESISSQPQRSIISPQANVAKPESAFLRGRTGSPETPANPRLPNSRGASLFKFGGLRNRAQNGTIKLDKQGNPKQTTALKRSNSEALEAKKGKAHSSTDGKPRFPRLARAFAKFKGLFTRKASTRTAQSAKPESSRLAESEQAVGKTSLKEAYKKLGEKTHQHRQTLQQLRTTDGGRALRYDTERMKAQLLLQGCTDSKQQTLTIKNEKALDGFLTNMDRWIAPPRHASARQS